MSIYIIAMNFVRGRPINLPLLISFLNQARAWFLRIASVRKSMRVCVCVSAPEATNN